MDDVQEIRRVLTRINDAWLKGAPEDIPAALDSCFHEAMVIVGPEFQKIGVGGKPACIQSYVDFMTQAAVRSCELSEPDIHVAGDSAMATYRWSMVYEMNGQEFRESGYDVMAFTRFDGRWVAFWRALLPSSA